LSIFVIAKVNICLLHHCSFFYSRSNWMATDIDSLISGLDVNVVRLGIGLRRTWGGPRGALTFLL
jgi:hypothetical protein